MQNIQWFPGHMAKAKREILEKMQMVDLVIELRDARIPYSSSNPMINDIVGKKPRLILLCKANMADPNITKDWINYYNEQGKNCYFWKKRRNIIKNENKKPRRRF